MSIADEILQLAATKAAIRAAIEAQGVVVGNAPFADYAARILDINAAPLVSPPAIDGLPIVVGGTTEGSLLLAAPAPVTGAPSPTRSWQWMRSDGGGFVDIAGATANTYQLSWTDEGHQITVRQIETNDQGQDDAIAEPIDVPVVNRAAVVVLLGQSLMAPRGATVQASGGSAGFAWMPAGGTSITDWDFFPSNATHTGHWNELASAVPYSEGALQSPGAGVAQQLEGGRYQRAYIGNVAIGARDLQTLMTGGPLNNAWATIFRLCEIARADGFQPEVMFASRHGEANAFSGTTEQAYYDLGVEYYGRLQLYAAQAMRSPGYVAPVVLTYPAQQGQTAANLGENDRAIKEAIRRLCVEQPGFIDGGGIYQWPVAADRVHPEVGSYVLGGEWIGRVLRLVTAGTPPAAPLRITGVTLAGTTFTATFSKPVVRDTSLGVGQNLATATAEDGLEWIDNGVAIAIVAGSLVYSGNTVSGTLASAPTGTLAQQVLRIAEQYTSGTLTAGAANLAGSVVRADEPAWTANYGATPMYDFAIPQRITGVS